MRCPAAGSERASLRSRRERWDCRRQPNERCKRRRDWGVFCGIRQRAGPGWKFGGKISESVAGSSGRHRGGSWRESRLSQSQGTRRDIRHSHGSYALSRSSSLYGTTLRGLGTFQICSVSLLGRCGVVPTFLGRESGVLVQLGLPIMALAPCSDSSTAMFSSDLPPTAHLTALPQIRSGAGLRTDRADVPAHRSTRWAERMQQKH